ncbi:MAG: serine hydrolase domain-containing protein [Clostridium sp.]
MKIIGVLIGAALVCAAVTSIVIYRKKIKLLYKSLNSFKDENLANTFQNIYNIQPTREIKRGNNLYGFIKDEEDLPLGFEFKGEKFLVSDFLKNTKTSGLIVIKDDKIKHESYYLGANENTLFASNSMGKSFVSALMGIAIYEGYIESIDEPIGKYINEFKNTEIENIPIKACLQMTSGLAFDEDNDMSKYSMRTLLGTQAIKIISKIGLEEEPFKSRKYLSINTEILGEIIRNATGYTLTEFMEEKLWKKLGVERNAFWTLSNDKELAMGGLSISLRDYARFARLYLNNGVVNNEQVIPKEWIKDSMDISEAYAKPGASNDSYSDIGYGYQWWIPEGNEEEFLAIGVYSQWIYVNRAENIIVVKTSADPNFMEKDYELKHIEFFRELSKGYIDK